MAFKKKNPVPATGMFRAREGFIYQGQILVSIGDVAEAGHPILKGREHLFQALVPRFSVSSAEPAPEPESEPEDAS